MRVFVTGATGFVGSHVVQALTAQGHDPVILARSDAKVRAVFGDAPPEVIPGSLSNDDSLRAGCEGTAAVIHIAGIVAAKSPDEFHLVNAEGTRRLAEIARDVQPDLTRFVYVSSQSAVGPNAAGQPIDETRETRPISEYGRSKLRGEHAVEASRLPWTILRPAAVYGPRDVEFLKMFKMARLGLAPVFAGGRMEVSMIYGPDLAEGIVACLHPDAAERTYFAAHPEHWTQRELGAVIYRAVRARDAGTPLTFSIPGPVARAALGAIGGMARLAGKATLLTSDKVGEFLAEAWTCRSDALQQDTGWIPRTGLEEGTRTTAEWYRKNGWL